MQLFRIINLARYLIFAVLWVNVALARSSEEESLPLSRLEVDELQKKLDASVEPNKFDFSPFVSRLKGMLVNSLSDKQLRWQVRYLLAYHYFNIDQCYQVESLYPEDFTQVEQELNVFLLMYFKVRAECLAKSEGPKKAAELHVRIAEELLALGHTNEAIDPLSRAGVYKYRQAKYTESLALHERSLVLARANRNTLMQAKALLNTGASYAALEQNGDAITALMDGLALSRQLKIPKFEAFANTTIGAIYMYSKEPEKAKPFYLAALEIHELSDSLYGQFICYVNLSIIEQSLKNLDQATFYGQKSLQAAREQGDDNHIGNALIRLGSLESELKRYELAKAHFEEALKIYLSLNNVDRIGYTYLKYVDLYLGQKKYEEGLALSNLAEAYIEQTESPQIHLGYYSQRIIIFEHLKDYERAFTALVKKTELEKEVEASKKSREFEEVLQKYAAIEREKELTDLKNEKVISDLRVEQGIQLRSMLVFGLVIAILLSLLLFKLYTDSRRKSQSIEEQRLALEAAHTKLEQIAMTDELTRIMNRRAIMNTLAIEWERSKRTKTPLSVIMFDVDHFKSFNDTWGHDGGDYVLQQLAEQVESLKRKHEYFARWGGEEFILVLPQQNIHEAREAAERIRRHIENWRFEYKDNSKKNHLLSVTITMGCADNAGPNSSLNGMIKHADLALYKGKEKGRNQVQTYPLTKAGSPTRHT